MKGEPEPGPLAAGTTGLRGFLGSSPSRGTGPNIPPGQFLPSRGSLLPSPPLTLEGPEHGSPGREQFMV
jgi:hypothetical protein